MSFKSFMIRVGFLSLLLVACTSNGDDNNDNDDNDNNCDDGNARCDDDVLEVCDDGEWEEDEDCADDGLVCLEDNDEDDAECVEPDDDDSNDSGGDGDADGDTDTDADGDTDTDADGDTDTDADGDTDTDADGESDLPSVQFNGTTLYVMPEDQPIDGCAGPNEPISGAESETDGESNTSAFVSAFGTSCTCAHLTTLTCGPSSCYTLSAHGFDDWYAPSIDELSALYDNHESIGGFKTSDSDYMYCSSTMSGHTTSPRVSFSDGSVSGGTAMDGFSRIHQCNVRCVRRD